MIDDLANRPHDCDLLIDTTFGRSAEDYRDLVPPGAVILAGARYALLRPEFAALRAESLARRAAGGGVERILVSLGLTDLGGITARVVAALLETALKAQIDVVIGPSAQSRAELEAFAARERRVELHIDPPDMARLMTNADIAIGAGGTTSWERCCLGLPTIVIILADNQVWASQMLNEFGAINALMQTSLATDIPNAIAELVDPTTRREMTGKAADVTDGRGAERVCEAIIAIATAKSSQ